MLSDEKYTNIPTKCDICQYRYACNDHDEYNCKTNDYRRFTLDKEKLKLYEEEKEVDKMLTKQSQIKYGEWEPVEEENFWIHNMEESLITGKPTKAIMPRCSCCKKVFGTIAFDFKYCPECGVKMKGKKND
jgi:hypothetical protein